MAGNTPDINLNVNTGNLRESLRDIASSIDRLNRSIDHMGQKVTDNFNRGSSGAKKQRDSLSALEKEYRDVSRQIAEIQSKSNSADEQQLRKKSQLIQRQRQLREEMKKTGTQGATSTNKVTAAQSKLNNQVSLGRQLFLRLRSVMLTVFGAYAIINGIKNTVNTIKEFELGMARLAAITGETGEAIERIGNINKVLAGRGIFSAAEISGIQVQLAKYGFTLKEISQSTEGIIKLATATGEDLNSATVLVSSSIRALGLDASETARLVDVLGKSFTSSALDVDKFRESAKYVLPLARKMDWTIEQVASTLGKLADAGINGSLAGTGLRQTFINLWDSSSDLSQVLGAGIKTFDQFYDAIIEAKNAGVSFDEVLAAVPVRAKTMFTVLWNGAEDIKVYANELERANGAIDEMANKQMDTLAYQIDRANAAWKSFIVSLQDSGGFLKTFFKNLSNELENAVRFMNPTATGLLDGAKAFEEYKKKLDATGQSKNWRAVQDAMAGVSESVKTQREEVERLSEYNWWSAPSISSFFHIDDLQRATTELSKQEELLRMMSKLDFDIRVDENVESSISETLKTLEQLSGLEEYDRSALGEFLSNSNMSAQETSKFLTDFRVSYKNTLSEISATTSALYAVGNDEMGNFFANVYAKYKEWGQETIALVSGDVTTLVDLQRDANKNRLKYLNSFYDMQRKLELQRNENKLQSDEDREKASLAINMKYDGLKYQALLDYGELTKSEREITNELLLELEKTYTRESGEITDKFYDEWIEKLRKKNNELIALEKLRGEVQIQQMKNEGATEAEIWLKTKQLEIDAAEKQLEFAMRAGESADEIERLRLNLEKLNLELAAGPPTDKVGNDLKKIGSAYKRLASEIVDSLQTIADAQVEQTETIVNDLNTRISEVQRDLERETELYMEGYANNVTTKEKELRELKEAREQAIKDREAAVKKQQALEAVSQAIDLASAVANTISIYSEIPIVGLALAAAAVAGFLALFATSQSKAKSYTQYGSGGEVHGNPHARGGVDIEAEGGEFVVRKSAYSKHRELVNAINDDNLPVLDTKVLSNTIINDRGDVIVNDDGWRELYGLLDERLKAESIKVVGNKKIITSGIRKRIVNV